MDYNKLCQMAEALCDVDDVVCALSNLSALIFDTVDDINWAGFYIVKNGRLVLGPFQGKVACAYIDLGHGVCGTAARLGGTVRVDDVHKFSGHIACDSRSNSEIVVPIKKNGRVVAVLDIDSESFGRFTVNDQKGLEMLVKIIEKKVM